MHTAESEFLKFMIKYEYMGEIEIIFENTLALLSGAQRVCIMKIENLVSHSLIKKAMMVVENPSF